MKRSLVITIIGPDRPGLVERVADTVGAHGGNWVESQMVQLAGRFAGVLRVEVDRGQDARLAASLQALAAEGIQAVVQPSEGQAPTGDGRPMQLELVGHDRVGIVRDITHALASVGVNVIELTTQVFSAPMSGELMFKATAQLQAPDQVDLDGLKDRLDAIAEKLHLDLALSEASV